MFSVRRAVFCSAGVFAMLALSTGIASASPIVPYQITTAGCFNCTTADGFTDTAYGGYTFDGVAMSNGATDAFGTATVFLGTLARDNDNYSQSPTGSDFLLQFSFLLPLSIGDGTDALVATIVGSQGEPGDLNFDNTFKTYTFTSASGTGSFEFRVNDILALNKNHEAALTGDIRGMVFTDTAGADNTAADLTQVPEPTSLLLLGTGFAGVAAKLRKRRTQPVQ